MSIIVERLQKRFAAGVAPAVNDVSFHAPSGSVTSLLGPSGSGKTTVLRLIAGLERADAGRVRFGDEDLSDVPVQKRGVGFVFQGYALFEHLTVRGNVAFGLKVQRLSRRVVDDRVDELLALVQLEGYADRRPSQLSGGQRQRVAFARALATRPKVLLLDEPFGALDARVRVELRAWLAELHRKLPVTTLLVTHDQDEAFELSEQVVVMHDGKVAQAGSPHDIYDTPATPFVASFIGNANSVRARAVDGREGVAYVRPQDVKLVRADEGPSDAPPAQILAMLRIGGFVKIEVRLATAERMTVQLSRAEAEALRLREGDRVRVLLGERKVFVVGDYSI
jgi:sulfate/thiosulfate transport system ATP-binding protein